MITQILNREFVLEQLALVRAELAAPAKAARRDGAAPPEIPGDDRAAALELLAEAGAHEAAVSSGQQGYEGTPVERRGEAVPPIDDVMFMSHDPVVSLLQSALTEYFHEQGKAQLALAPRPARRGGGVAFDPVGAAGLVGVTAKPASAGRRLFNKFSETDPRWVASLFAMGVRKFRHRHPFNPNPAPPVTMGRKARLVLVGDWGTGLPRAVNVAGQMRKVIEEGKAAGLEQHVIHLGDVYYSGWEEEYRRNFLPAWPVTASETGPGLRSWCLNGNHDMYAGGHAYFDFLLADPRFAAQGKSSYFSLHNEDWDILGLDTAYEDEGLCDPQFDWIKAKRRPGTRSMLLSHHQLFSAYEKPCLPLQAKLGAYLLGAPVDVWFWGHEHRCVFYKESEGVKHARLIGHGGVPVYMNHAEDAAYPVPAYYEYRKYRPRLLERWAYFGFAVVDLDGPTARVSYVDEFGNQHAAEVLP